MFYNLKPFRGTRIPQYFSALIATLSATSTSTHSSWTSPTIPLLMSKDSPLGRPITTDESSWIVSILLLTSIIPGLTYHIIIAKYGRKQTLHICSVLFIISWCFIIFGNDVIYIFLARGIAGLAIGTVVITTVYYTAEISDSDIRGQIGSIIGMMKLFGTIIILAIGPFVSYQLLGIVCGIFPLISFIFMFFIPESPYYLVKNNKLDEAKEAIIYLSGTDDETIIEKKLNTICSFVQTAEKPLGVLQVLSDRKYLRVISLLMIYITCVYFGGGQAINAYLQFIIDKTDSLISPKISSIIFGVVQIPSAILSAFLIDRVGRKMIIYIGEIGCMISLIMEGIYFYLEDTGVNVSNVSWMPTTGIVMFLVMNSLHYTIPFILLGEIFTTKIKDAATMMFLTAGVAAVFIVMKTFEPMSEAWGIYTSFWIYAFFSLLSVVFAYFFIPETKGKTFKEITDKLYA